MSLLDDVEPLYDADDSSWGPGPVCRLHLPGHVDDDTATAVAWAWLYDQELDGRIDRPRRLWTSSRVDGEGEQVVVYSTTPRDGWAPVTRIDLDPVPYRPCAHCAWHATTGLPEAGGRVWVCEGHAAEMRSLRAEERAEAERARIHEEDQVSRRRDEPAHGTTVTLGQAVAWLSTTRPVVGCACIGPIPPDDLCLCQRQTVEARAVHRAAHIAAKLLLDVLRERSGLQGQEADSAQLSNRSRPVGRVLPCGSAGGMLPRCAASAPRRWPVEPPPGAAAGPRPRWEGHVS